MTILPRAAGALAACLVALTACSGSDGSPSSDAHTTACRTYQLETGGQDGRAVTLLDRAARSGSWDNTVVNDALASVRAAATHAGLVEGLSEDDFGAFSGLVDATVAAYARANPNGGLGITGATGAILGKAVDAVHAACDLD
ncbi:hypothetical protein [Nocardioides aquiterrae]|uniref:Lipoprotein n=1 Tax=Nocardioides aquiterrae TaxID=203799 RepID=A0ABN1UDK2_9ACTN